MAILRIELDNILCFNKFEADFSYPKKIVKSPLGGEYLSHYPSIRYKKVNILIGSNATGKTSLGKAIWTIFLFLRDKESKTIRNVVSDTNKEATFLMDCVFAEGIFFRFEGIVRTSGDVDVRYRALPLTKLDTYETLIKRLPETEFANHVKALDGVAFGGWNFCFPTIEDGFDIINCKYDDNESRSFISIFEHILKTLDPSIKEVFKSNEQENTFIIKLFNNKTIAVKHGEKISGLNHLSSGTKYAINIAGLMYSIKNHDNGFYYADEQFSYVNSDIEIACLAMMIDLLGDGEQLFFTTHNAELMNISLPNHCFAFLKKKKEENGQYSVSLIDASYFEKRNNVNIKNLYDNDYFDVAPDTSEVFNIGNN